MSLIFERLASAQAAADDPTLSEALWKEFGCERTVLVLDMAGFTRTSREFGVVYYLTLIEKMRRLTAPLVTQEGGRVVKYEADNLFAVFFEPVAGLSFLQKAYAAVDAVNADQDDAAQIHLCAGLDHGEILLDEADFYGDPVNMASKLGEDLARRGEVLVSSAVAGAVSSERYRFKDAGNHGLYGATTPVHRWDRD